MNKNKYNSSLDEDTKKRLMERHRIVTEQFSKLVKEIKNRNRNRDRNAKIQKIISINYK